jgi:hypothetical protein
MYTSDTNCRVDYVLGIITTAVNVEQLTGMLNI